MWEVMRRSSVLSLWKKRGTCPKRKIKTPFTWEGQDRIGPKEVFRAAQKKWEKTDHKMGFHIKKGNQGGYLSRLCKGSANFEERKRTSPRRRFNYEVECGKN